MSILIPIYQSVTVAADPLEPPQGPLAVPRPQVEKPGPIDYDSGSQPFYQWRSQDLTNG